MVEEMVVGLVVIQVVAMVAKKVAMKDDLLGGEKAAKMAVEMDDILVFVWVVWMVEEMVAELAVMSVVAMVVNEVAMKADLLDDRKAAK